jgi:nitrosocyanin
MRWLAIALAVVLLGSVVAMTYGGEVSLTIVNVVTPQDVKIWEPTSITVKKGDKVSLRLVNKHTDEHGYEISAFSVKEVVAGDKTASVSFVADKAGIFPIKCQLHPAHVVGQLVVLE